jgi:hypothetical protein
LRRATATPLNQWYQGAVDGGAVVEDTTQLALYGVAPRSGTRAAHLGEIGDYVFSSGDLVGRDSWVGKVITVPASASAIALSCNVHVDTEEPSLDESSDWLELWLYDESLGEYAYIFDEYSNLDAATGWYVSNISVEPEYIPDLAGRTLSVEAYSLVDDLYRTGFFVDSCSLKITYCQ